MIMAWNRTLEAFEDWGFSSDGSVTHRVWAPLGARWNVTTRISRPNGKNDSFTQILEKFGPEQHQWTITEQNGRELPTPIEFVFTKVDDLELKTTDTSAVTRADAGTMPDEVQAQLNAVQSPLGVSDYQAYQFNATPFRIQLAVSEIASRVTAEFRTLARIGESEAALECEMVITASRRTVYQARIRLPEGLEVEQVNASELSDWSIIELEKERILNVFFGSGQEGRFPIKVQGRLRAHAAGQQEDADEADHGVFSWGSSSGAGSSAGASSVSASTLSFL